MSKCTDRDLLDLTVEERGFGIGNALPAFPLCCSLALCLNRGCSSSCSSKAEAD